MRNWKSEENINHFIENSFGELAQNFLERGYDFYVDGFTPQPIFSVNVIKKDEDINWILETITLQCRTIQFGNYSQMISTLEDIGKDNYIFMFVINPFQMRIATISSEYEIPYLGRNQRLREQKLNELLNES